jgi:hypothetical protein
MRELSTTEAQEVNGGANFLNVVGGGCLALSLVLLWGYLLVQLEL